MLLDWKDEGGESLHSVVYCDHKFGDTRILQTGFGEGMFW
jgi:hypothetical protein